MVCVAKYAPCRAYVLADLCSQGLKAVKVLLATEAGYRLDGQMLPIEIGIEINQVGLKDSPPPADGRAYADTDRGGPGPLPGPVGPPSIDATQGGALGRQT